MKVEENYLEINKKAWNKRTDVHINSDFYDQQSFLNGNSSLKEIELALLGNVSGKKILHLQCHFGQDSLSLSKMGAEVTGVDFSENAISLARKTAKELGLNTKFICCDLYNLPNHLTEQFDLVFTSYGTIGWLPDVGKWASIVSQFLKPHGKFIFVEFHPVVWMFDEAVEKIQYSYFNKEAIIESSEGTYTDQDSKISYQSVGWNHDLGEVITSILVEGIEISHFNEYDFSPYPCFQNLEEYQKGRWRFKHHENRIPIVYSIVGHKK